MARYDYRTELKQLSAEQLERRISQMQDDLLHPFHTDDHSSTRLLSKIVYAKSLLEKMKKQQPLTQHDLNQARWVKLITKTLKHDAFCSCDECAEMFELGSQLSEQYEADFQERKIRIDNFLAHAKEVNQLPPLSKPDSIPYAQKTLNTSKPQKIGGYRI